jgi:hypothetical protein
MSSRGSRSLAIWRRISPSVFYGSDYPSVPRKPSSPFAGLHLFHIDAAHSKPNQSRIRAIEESGVHFA